MDIAIRKFRESDAGALHEAILESVDHLSEWLTWCTPDYGLKEAAEWTGSAAKAWEAGLDYRFVIEDRAQGKILGSVGIDQIVPQHKIGNLGYWVRASALNKGVSTKAARMAIRYAFDELGLQRIEVHVHPDNIASNVVASRLGGRYKGEFPNKLILNGQSVAAKCYSIIPSDYYNYIAGSRLSAENLAGNRLPGEHSTGEHFPEDQSPGDEEA